MRWVGGPGTVKLAARLTISDNSSTLRTAMQRPRRRLPGSSSSIKSHSVMPLRRPPLFATAQSCGPATLTFSAPTASGMSWTCERLSTAPPQPRAEGQALVSPARRSCPSSHPRFVSIPAPLPASETEEGARRARPPGSANRCGAVGYLCRWDVAPSQTDLPALFKDARWCSYAGMRRATIAQKSGVWLVSRRCANSWTST